MEKNVAPLDATRRANLDEATSTAGIVTGLAVAETALVKMQDCNRKLGRQESSTWKWSRSASTKSISSPVIAR